jgi:hypothetical protein
MTGCKRNSGYIAWIIAVFCLILSIKIKYDFYIGDMIWSIFSAQFDILLIIIPFIASVWIFSSIFKNIHTATLKWMRLSISILIVASFLSILILQDFWSH